MTGPPCYLQQAGQLSNFEVLQWFAKFSGRSIWPLGRICRMEKSGNGKDGRVLKQKAPAGERGLHD